MELSKFGEILVDNEGKISIKGGDVTNIALKQIVIAEGSGATAALGAFNYLMRN